jgi:hypothetical protein
MSLEIGNWYLNIDGAILYATFATAVGIGGDEAV